MLLNALPALMTHHADVPMQAPPGAGKTTVVPLALMLHKPGYLNHRHRGGATGHRGKKIIVLEPRRVAAKATARRMADMIGESVGETVGFRVRNERAIGPNTKIEVNLVKCDCLCDWLVHMWLWSWGMPRIRL